jgi:methyl-accepting chemotaxis protein
MPKTDTPWNWGNTLTVLGLLGIVGGTYTTVHSKNVEQDARIDVIERAVLGQAKDTKEILEEVRDIGLQVNTVETNSKNISEQISEMKQDIKQIKREVN